MSRDRTTILILLVALTAVGLWAWDRHIQLQGWYSPFFSFEVEPARNIAISRWKDTGGVVEYAYDRNEDLERDSVVVLGRSGLTGSIWVDEDYNGILEVSYVMDKHGRCVARYEDLGQDGFVEEFIHYANDTAYTFVDNNEDGRFTDDELRSKARMP